ncbi:unnamed protein product [Bursaphelenchus xylophilus]|uniref:(pine wood nematode) hypothetical protein n=1 Tax=Bursaphelenchus xylophilus TaxID=6326 RepID=A0A1I7S2C2_BURXY|nr:unnamed protein product [Bursaphelenchus xylophilus]CAG9114686.1 unnamed protein product [Bursaphelenchus xylophilus]
MRMNAEVLRSFIDHFIIEYGGNVKQRYLQSPNFERILRLNQKFRWLLLSQFNYFVVQCEENWEGKVFEVTVMKKKAKDEAPEMFGVQHKCPYDVLLYASYITTLDLRTYRGPLVADDEARQEIKRMKGELKENFLKSYFNFSSGEEKAIKLWNETKEVMVRLAELIKE